MRIATSSNYERILRAIQVNQNKLVLANEQAATGLRLIRPSDDPAGSARLVSLEQRLAQTRRFGETIGTVQPFVDAAAATLEDGSSVLSKARAALIQGMGGTLSPADRDTLANEIDALREELLSLANGRFDDRALFGGTETAGNPFATSLVGGIPRTVYQGDAEIQSVGIGAGVTLGVNIPGSQIFAAFEPAGTLFEGLTGAAGGTTADQGTGFDQLVTRHTSTTAATLGTVGVALANGGADDTLLGDNTLVIDTAAGTVQLGSGPPVGLPDPSDPTATSVVLENELGGTLNLDFSGFTGADFTGTVRGDGEVSLDGESFVALDFADTDLELSSSLTGNVAHVDTTGIKAAGSEVVTFAGTVNVFDTLAGIADDLRNSDDLDSAELNARLSTRLSELDRNSDNLREALGVLGARGARLNDTASRLGGVELQLQTLVSDVEDADITQVVLDAAQAEQALSLVQATGVRLIQNTLLNFL